MSLNEVLLKYAPAQFIETEAVPSDTQVVGETWENVNKDGSPDRRFARNSKIPIVQYGQLLFTSVAGLNEEFQFSNAHKAGAFWAAFEAHQRTVPLTQAPPLGDGSAVAATAPAPTPRGS